MSVQFSHTATGAEGFRSIRAFLREATAPLHVAIEARFADLFDVGERGYTRYLQATTAAVGPLEAALEAAGVTEILPDWGARARTTALVDDLADLGIAVPTCRDLPEAGGAARQFGILYALEGSRLGAKRLAGSALASPSGTVRVATRYLCHGEGRGLWPSFLEQLEASAAARRAPNEALQGALVAFWVFSDATDVGPMVEPAEGYDAKP